MHLHKVKHHTWINGVLEVIEFECNNFIEAKDFIKTLFGGFVKVYNGNKELCHEENLESIPITGSYA